MEDLLRAASAVLGEELTAAAGDLSGSDRATVRRARRPDGGTVIVKSYPQTAEGRRGFAAEASGLAFSSETGAGPGFLGTDSSFPLVIMTDLGEGQTLADVLLASPPSPAGPALESWAAACGRLAARMHGRADELAGLRAAYSGQPSQVHACPWLPRAVRETPRLLLLAGVDALPGLEAELGEIAAFAEPGEHDVFSPGDLCPDNTLVTASGVRLVDFEESGYQSVFLNAAYMRMPFSTCWCVLRLPPEIAARTEAAYRAEVCETFPGMASDTTWRHGMTLAMAAWTLHCMRHLLESSAEKDESMNAPVAAAPTARQLLRYRWRTLADELAEAGELPALAAAVRGLLAATGGWAVPDLPLYPAFG